MTCGIYPCHLLQLGLVFVLTAVSSAHVVIEWQHTLELYRSWSGYYRVYDIHYPCSLQVHSVQSGHQGTAMLTFRDNETVMDVSVFSYDDITMVFKLESMHKPSSRFPGDVDIRIEAKVVYIGGVCTISGNFTDPRNRGFGTFVVQPQNAPEITSRSKALTIGLAVGIPLVLMAMITVIAVCLIMWAIRKGYLRHVPCSFKTFRNPPDSDLRLENQCRAVHM
ncbi:uncharacterized protein LOC121372486 [Gigantopelta aegis]|uniref:uncharacterized protein LOC121372486 n=1 Tax=Gigantopelta aegis TaxID=1735272 RepID=UPI001B88CA34|nr:uncharacterized protein LOC121372486 [Gigantopelta aegis]XP_041354770.1 uncharacterized protein LOC121372486 [Gigantopelta aegis]